jgi:hypothetical protein
MALVITGLLNRQDAFDGESASSRVMRRMQAESIVDLAEMAMKRRLGQMSRLFDADPIAGRDDYASKVPQAVLLRPKLSTVLGEVVDHRREVQ